MRQCRFIKPLLLRTAPDPVSNRPRDLAELLYLGKRFHDLGEREMAETIRFWTMSIGEFLDQYFETEVVKANFAGSGIIGTGLGDYSPGTAYVLLHHYMGEVDGTIGAWGFTRGGVGGVTQAMARALREAGGELRSGAAVERILRSNGKVKGVVLEHGAEMESPDGTSLLKGRRVYSRVMSRRWREIKTKK